MQGRCSRATVVVGVAVAVAAAACGLDPASPADPEAGAASQAFTGGQCPDFGCGANSPVIDTQFDFHDLSLLGNAKTGAATLPNTAGLAILADPDTHRAQIVKGAVSYDLQVTGGRFSGTCRTLCPTLQGAALVGAAIPLTVKGTVRYAITIQGVRTMSYFLGGGTVEAYTLGWKDVVTGSSANLCNNITLLEQLLQQQAGDDTYAAQELMGMRTFESIVFEGDRIDARAKTMQPTADDTWFNLGCAGHTLSKLRLTRNTVHGQAAGLALAWQQRQATLKMLAADYCGGGTALTVAGQRLVWQGDLMPYFSTPIKIEARWTEQGAACLYAPRMLYPTSSLGASTFPDIWSSISAACTAAGKPLPPACTDLDPYHYGGAERVSANPRI